MQFMPGSFLRKWLSRRAAESQESHNGPHAGAGRSATWTANGGDAGYFAELVSGLRDYAVFLLDRQGNVLTWNAGAKSIKGYSADEILGQSFSRFYPPERVQSGWPRHALEQAAATGRFEDEGWRMRKDGSRFWANVVITAIRNEEGEVTRFLKVTRDLTDRKLAEERLRASEQNLRLLIEGVRDYAIFRLDLDGNVASWNPGAETLTGYTSEEIIGQPFSRFFAGEEIARGTPERILSETREKNRFEAGTQLERRDGSQVWARVTISALHDSDGSVQGFASVIRDLTDQQIAEENARRLLREEIARQAAEENALAALRGRENEARQRERLFATLASIGDGVIVISESNMVTFLNSAAESLTGWSLGEAAGKPFESVVNVIHEHSREPATALLTGPPPGEDESGRASHTVLVSRDGTERAIDSSSAPIRERDGAVVGTIIVFRDVARQRAAEAALQQSEESLRLAQEAGRMGSWEWHLATGRIIWSPTLERIHGLADRSFEGTFESWRQVIHPDDVDRVLTTVQNTQEEGTEFQLEYRVVWPDGSVHWLESRGTLFRHEEGHPERLIGVSSDITGRKYLEQSMHFLSEASKSLALLVDYRSTLEKVARLAVPEFADWCAVDILEPDGQLNRVAVAHVDPARIEMAEEAQRRYPPRANAPHGPQSVVRTGQSELIADISDELLVAHARDAEHLRIVRELGLKSYICVPLRWKATVLGVMTFATAESGRRYTPDDLSLAQDLAHRAAIAIENARLYQQVQAADRRKDEFLAMLAHELRNPLAPLRSGLEVLSLDSRADLETISLMQDQVEHIVRLVDDLMDVSRIMKGKVELRRETVDVATLVKRSVQTVQPTIDEHRQTLRVEMPESPIWIHADPVRIVQVFENLLNNASKYTDARGHIRISAEERDGQALIRFVDTGVGIEKDLLPVVFDLFTQSSRSLDRAQGGLGIGLTLVKDLVEMHWGKVTAESEGPGRGSTFTVFLPLASPPSQDATETSRTYPRNRYRIVVVDDNLGAARLLGKILLKIDDHEVELAGDGPSALDCVARFAPHIVFLDIGLPGIDGFQVGEAIRELPGGKEILLVALTGYGQEEDRRRTREAGFDVHLVKPTSVEQIKALLNHPRLAARNAVVE
jgi:PAS domain S-box-containing protein